MFRMSSACALAIVAVLGMPLTAAAAIKLKFSPIAPIVDDSVNVSWRADRNLKPGYHYEAMLVTPPGNGCAGFVVKQSKRRPKKGKPMSFRFSPYDDKLNGGSEWCQGKATVSISISKDGGTSGNIIDAVSFRFRAKP